MAVLQLRQQAVHVQLQASLRAHAQTSDILHTHLRARPQVTVAVNQRVPVHLQQTLNTQSQVQARVPIDTQFQVNVMVPVSTTLHTQVRLYSWLPEVAVNLPVHLDVPVRMTVPVHVVYPLNLQTQVRVHAPPTVMVPLHTQFRLRAPIDIDLEATLLTHTSVQWLDWERTQSVSVDETQLHVPLGTIQWQVHGQVVMHLTT